MNILLTGANGFIGTYFQKHYSQKYNIQAFSFRTATLDDLDLSNTDTIIHLSALVHQMGGASEKVVLNLKNLYSVEDGIRLMLNYEC